MANKLFFRLWNSDDSNRLFSPIYEPNMGEDAAYVAHIGKPLSQGINSKVFTNHRFDRDDVLHRDISNILMPGSSYVAKPKNIGFSVLGKANPETSVFKLQDDVGGETQIADAIKRRYFKIPHQELLRDEKHAHNMYTLYPEDMDFDSNYLWDRLMAIATAYYDGMSGLRDDSAFTGERKDAPMDADLLLCYMQSPHMRAALKDAVNDEKFTKLVNMYDRVHAPVVMNTSVNTLAFGDLPIRYQLWLKDFIARNPELEHVDFADILNAVGVYDVPVPHKLREDYRTFYESEAPHYDSKEIAKWFKGLDRKNKWEADVTDYINQNGDKFIAGQLKRPLAGFLHGNQMYLTAVPEQNIMTLDKVRKYKHTVQRDNPEETRVTRLTPVRPISSFDDLHDEYFDYRDEGLPGKEAFRRTFNYYDIDPEQISDKNWKLIHAVAYMDNNNHKRRSNIANSIKEYGQ